jgi:hypothetical protein
MCKLKFYENPSMNQVKWDSTVFIGFGAVILKTIDQLIVIKA